MAIYGNIENLDAVILGDITAEPIHIDGEDGRGIVSAQINAQQHLIITYTDGTTEDAGAVGEGAGVVIDPTLSIEGAAAEAKATGDALAEKLGTSGGTISGDLAVTGEFRLGSTVAMEETNESLLTLIGDNGEPVRIRNVDTPFADNDAATKKYVDEHSGGDGNVEDVTVNGESVVTDGVAEIDLTGYALKSDLDDYVSKDETEEAEQIEIDSTITEGSANLITSGAVFAAIGDVEAVINAIRGVS